MNNSILLLSLVAFTTVSNAGRIALIKAHDRLVGIDRIARVVLSESEKQYILTAYDFSHPLNYWDETFERLNKRGTNTVKVYLSSRTKSLQSNTYYFTFNKQGGSLGMPINFDFSITEPGAYDFQHIMVVNSQDLL